MSRPSRWQANKSCQASSYLPSPAWSSARRRGVGEFAALFTGHQRADQFDGRPSSLRDEWRKILLASVCLDGHGQRFLVGGEPGGDVRVLFGGQGRLTARRLMGVDFAEFVLIVDLQAFLGEVRTSMR